MISVFPYTPYGTINMLENLKYGSFDFNQNQLLLARKIFSTITILPHTMAGKIKREK